MRDLLERALAIKEREYGREHREARPAGGLQPLRAALCDARDLLERAPVLDDDHLAPRLRADVHARLARKRCFCICSTCFAFFAAPWRTTSVAAKIERAVSTRSVLVVEVQRRPRRRR